MKYHTRLIGIDRAAVAQVTVEPRLADGRHRTRPMLTVGYSQ